ALLARTPHDDGLRLAIALVHQWQGDLLGAERELEALAARAPANQEIAAALATLRADPVLAAMHAEQDAAEHPTDTAVLERLVAAGVAAERFVEVDAGLTRARGLGVDVDALERTFAAQKSAKLEARLAADRAAAAEAPDDVARRITVAEDL